MRTKITLFLSKMCILFSIIFAFIVYITNASITTAEASYTLTSDKYSFVEKKGIDSFPTMSNYNFNSISSIGTFSLQCNDGEGKSFNLSIYQKTIYDNSEQLGSDYYTDSVSTFMYVRNSDSYYDSGDSYEYTNNTGLGDGWRCIVENQSGETKKINSYYDSIDFSFSNASSFLYIYISIGYDTTHSYDNTETNEKYGYVKYKVTLYNDTTAPSITVKTGSSSISNNSFIKNSATIKCNDEHFNKANIYQNDSLIKTITSTSDSCIVSDEGIYKIEASDVCNNKSTFIFTIDTTAPTINVSVSNGQITNQSITYNISDTNFSRLEINNTTSNSTTTSYSTNGTIEAEGIYKLKAYDKAGNYSEYSFTIDKSAPTLNGMTLKNGKYYLNVSKNIGLVDSYSNIDYENSYYQTPAGDRTKFSVSNNQAQIKNTIEGSWIIHAVDCLGNYKDYEIIIDKTNPVIEGAENNDYYNSNKIIYWSDINFDYALIDGTTSIVTSQVFSSEGTHTIKVFDKAGNSSQISITIDKTNPRMISLPNFSDTFNNIYYFTSSLTFSYYTGIYDVNQIMIDNSLYKEYANPNSSSDSFEYSTDGQHTIIFKDKAGNKLEYTFILEQNAPIGVLSGVDNNGITNNNVNLTWNMLGATATLNGNSYESGSPIDNDGKYTIILSGFKKSTTYTFEIDKTAPTIVGVTNGAYYNENKTISWSDTNFFNATLENKTTNIKYTYEKTSTTVSYEGIYLITVYDKASNSCSYTFTIDKTVPTIAGITNGVYYNENKTISWSDTNFASVIIKKNNTIIVKDSSIKFTTTSDKSSTLDSYEICVTDKANNSTTLIFYVTYSNPQAAWYDTKGNLVTDKIVNYDVKLVWSKSFDTEEIEAILNNQKYINGNVLSQEGTYEIRLTNQAGNSQIYSITIDNTAPEGTLKATLNNTTIDFVSKNGKLYTRGNVIFTWTESGATAILNDLPYSKNQEITTEGEHTIRLSDPYGNSNIYSFIIDKTAPTGKWLNYQGTQEINNNDAVNFDVKFTFDTTDATATLNGNTYTSGDKISQEGTYKIILTDFLGNISNEYSITIDKTAPEGTLNTTTNFVNLNNQLYTNGNVTFTWIEKNCNALVNGKSYEMGTIITEDGEYTIQLFDVVGNSNIYQFIIYTNNPEYKIYVDNTEVTKTIFNSINGFKIVSNNNITCNNEQYSSGTIIKDEGVYTFIITDFIGNTSTVTCELDFTPDTTNLNNFIKNGYSTINHWWESYTYIQDSSYNYVKNTTYSFTSYTDCFDFAKLREQSTYEYGIYSGDTIYSNKYHCYVSIYNLDVENAIIGQTYIIYKSPSSKTTYNVYFTSSYVDEIANQYATDTITEKTISQSQANGYPGDDEIKFQNMYLTQDGLTLIYFNSKISFIDRSKDNITLEINGYRVTNQYKTEISTDGLYLIRETDLAGNITEYYLCLDTQKPQFQLNGSKENLNNKDSVYITNTCSISTDSNAVLKIVLEDGSIEYVYSGSYNFTKTGIYEISAIDLARNKTTTKYIYLSFEQLSILTTPKLNDELEEIGFYFNISKNNKLNEITTIQVQFYNEDDEAWQTISSDATGILISNKNYSYYFTNSGKYRIIIIDNFGRQIESTYEINRLAPKGTLYTSSGQALSTSPVVTNKNGDILDFTPVSTNSSVYLDWNDEAGNRYTATIIYKNGELVSETYSKQILITTAGVYIIRLQNNDNGYAYFAFEIDKTAPTGYFIDENSVKLTKTATNQKFAFTWDEEQCTAYYYTQTSQNHIVYYSNTFITLENVYYFVLTDKSGNSSIYQITLDLTAPKVTIYSNNKTIANNSYTNGKVKFVFTESNCTATLNGDEYLSGTIITANGQYVLKITDSVGNLATYTVRINTTPVTISILSQTNIQLAIQQFYNESIKIYSNKDDVTATLNGFEYTIGNLIEEEGTYALIIIDKYGNTLQQSITIDKTAPTGTLTTTQTDGFQKDNFTNGNVTFTWSEKYLTVALDGNDYTKGTVIKKEGYHTITITDQANNFTTYNFTIDKTPISVDIIGVLNGGVTNTNVSIIYDVEEGSIQYVNGYIDTTTEFSFEASYLIEIYDQSLNKTTINFIIDKTAPEGTITTTQTDGFQENNITNGNVSFTWTESGCKATLDGSEYSKNQIIRTEGPHIINLYDKAGNISTYTFTIDKTYANFEVVGVEEGGITNQVVYITWDILEQYIALLNGNKYYPGNLIEEEGIYTFEIYSRSLQKTSFTFEIDKTTPTGTLTTTQSDGFKENNLTNGNVTFTWTESGCKATLDGKDYTKDTIVKTEGPHYFILQDKAGNSTSYYCTINKQGVEYELTGVNNNDICNSNVMLDILGNYKAAIIKFNDEPTNSESKYFMFTKEGLYEIVLTSLAGTQTIISFEIDKTAPGGTLTTTQTDGFQKDNFTYGNITFSWTESGCKATLDGNNYTKGTTIKTEGPHHFILQDKAGNSTSYYCTINKKSVEYELTGVENNGSCNTVVTLKILDNYRNTSYVYNQNQSISEDKYFMFTEEGKYEITLTSIAGTLTVISFEIDLTAPEGTLATTQEEGFQENNLTNGNVTFTWTETNCKATLNNENYLKGTIIKAKGNYELKLFDAVGNFTTYNFIIDKTLPEFTINGSLNSKNRTNNSLSFTWDNESYRATLNGEEYISGQKINLEGNYQFILTSKSLNTNILNFEIDKTAPTGEIKNINDEIITAFKVVSTNIYFTWTESGCKATLDGKDYAKGTIVKIEGSHCFTLQDELGNTSTYEIEINKQHPNYTVVGVNNEGFTASKVFAIWSSTANYTVTLNGMPYEMGTDIIEDGFYTFIFKGENNLEDEFVFTIDSTVPEGILKTTSEFGFIDDYITNGNVSFTWDNETYSCSINNDSYNKDSLITKEGSYLIVLTSLSGQQSSYYFIIDKTAPTAIISGLNEDKYYSNNIVTIDCKEKDAILTLNGNTYNLKDEISEEGIYELIISDKYHNSSKYTFEIDKTAPEGTLTTTQIEGFQKDNFTYGNVTFTWTEDNVTCLLDKKQYRSGTLITSEGTHFIQITDIANNTREYIFTIDMTFGNIIFLDSENNTISTEKSLLTAKDIILNYNNESCEVLINSNMYDFGTIIKTPGYYEIEIIYLQTKSSNMYYLEIDKTAPEGTLTGVDNNGITSSNVSFTWTESGCKATLNGEYYTKGTQIKNNGPYEIILTNNLGVSSTYIFTINKTYPTVIFKNEYGEEITIELDQYINFNIIPYFDEEKYSCILNEEEFISGTILSEEGEYSLIVTSKENKLSTTYVFTIDKTAPTFTVKANDEILENNAKTNKSVIITWDKNEAYLYTSKNGEEFKREYAGSVTISTNGSYLIKVVDKAGNYSTFSFERNNKSISKDDVQAITKSEENGEIIEENSSLSSKNYNKALSIRISGNYKATLSYTKDGELIEENYTEHELNENNNYQLTLEDDYGNSATYKFTIAIPDPEDEKPSYLSHNIALILIVSVPTIGILILVFFKFKGKNKNQFRAKKIK